MQKSEYKRLIARGISLVIMLVVIAVILALFDMQTATKVNASSGENDVYYKVTGTGNDLTLKLGTKAAIPDGKLYSRYPADTLETAGVEKKRIKKVVIADRISPESTNGYFSSFTNLEEIVDLQKLDTTNVTDMTGMFYECKSLKKLDLSGFDTSKVTSMNVMFYECSGLQELNISTFDTSKVTIMCFMFACCSDLQEVDLSKFDTSGVTNMSCMFNECSSLQELDVSNFDTTNVTDMGFMFNDCNNLQKLDVSNFDTTNVTDMGCMFAGCSGLQKLDLSSFNTANVTDMAYMFDMCYELKTIYASDYFVVDKVGDSQTVFRNCYELVGGAGTVCESYENYHRSYARIDGKDDEPGFFTEWTFKSFSWVGDDEEDYWEGVAYYTLYDSDETEEIKVEAEEVEDEETDPTCEEPGMEVYRAYLTKDDSLDYVPRQFTRTVVLPAEGHDYGEWERLDDKQHQKVCGNDESHVIKENHVWNGGEVTRKATTVLAGEKEYKCKVCGATKKEVLPKLKQPGSAEKAILSMKKDADLKGSIFRELKLTSKKQSRSSVKLQWKKMSKAVKYDIYGNKCGAKNRLKKLASVKGTSKAFKKLLGKKVKKGRYYKFIVVALDKSNNTVSISKMVHVATKGGKVGNPKKVIIRAGKKAIKATALKKGSTLKLKTKLKPANKKQKIKKHVSMRYESSNPKVAAVSRKGVITAKSKGSCVIYAYAQNGVYKTVKVSVQ